MTTEAEKMRAITTDLRRYNDAREPWYKHIKATGACYCGAKLTEPIARWATEHTECSVSLAPERPMTEPTARPDAWTTNGNLNADHHDGQPVIPVLSNPGTPTLWRARQIIAKARREGDVLDFGMGLETKIMAALAEPRFNEAVICGHERLIEQAKHVVRAWEDDPTSTETENAIRELGLRAGSAMDAGQRVAKTNPATDCPGPECLMCSGEACSLCGAGCWDPSVNDCEHDSVQRHISALTAKKDPTS